MFPSEIFSLIIEKCNFRTKTQFLLVNKELSGEAQRKMKPKIVVKGDKNIRKEIVGDTTCREEGIQIITTYKTVNGKEYKQKVKYLNNNKHHREGAPAVTWWYSNGNKWYEFWYRDGKRSREGAPAVTWWYENGNKRYEGWYENGNRSRESAPAVTGWYENGNKWYEAWYRDGKEHREGAPAVTEWYEDGNKMYEYWYRDGELIK